MEKQRKHSKKRQAILDAICSTNSHPSAEWIYSKLKDEYPKLSLGTVYRNIALFKKMGEIVCVDTVDGQERYDGDISQHSHFICSSCGCIVDIGGSTTDKLVDLAILPDDIKLLGYKLTFYGLCGICRKSVQDYEECEESAC